MGFKALTVNTAAEAAGHIYAEDDAAIFQSMFGGDGVLNIGNCLKSTVISNNKVRISDGVVSVGGHIGRLSHADYQDMTIENGATGYNRNDIIYARFLTSGNVDSFILAVKKGTATTGTATDPALVQGNLYEGAVERDYPLYRVKLSGLSISSVDQLFTVIPTIPDLKAQMEKDKAEIKQSLHALNEGSGCAYKGIQVIYKRNVDIVEGLYTSALDGFVQGIAKTAAKSGNPFIRLEINDSLIFEGSGVSKNYSYLWSPLFEVRKGDVIKYVLTSDTDDSNKELRIYLHRARRS